MQTIIYSECQNPQTLTGCNTAVYTARHLTSHTSTLGSVFVQLFFVITVYLFDKSTGAQKVLYFTYIMLLFHMTKKGHCETSLRSVCPVCVCVIASEPFIWFCVIYGGFIIILVGRWRRPTTWLWLLRFLFFIYITLQYFPVLLQTLPNEQNEAHYRRSFHTSQVKTSA